MAVRSRFIKSGTSLHIYVVEWESSAPSWADFCGKVLGPTDPAQAPADSLRDEILAKRKELGVETVPDGATTACTPLPHHSRLAERNNWRGAPFAKDTFGRLLLS